MWCVALSVALARGIAEAAEEAKSEVAKADSTATPASGKQPQKPPAAGPKKPAATEPKKTSTMGMAQFAMPKVPTAGKAPSPELPQRLTYQYAYGSQSDIVYRRDPDLNRRVRDDSLIFAPQLNAYVTYRPSDWLETTLEMKIDKEFPAVEEGSILLPNGETQFAADRNWSLLIEQIYLSFKAPAERFRLTVGRRNYEDERHWLVDTSMDTAALGFKLGQFRAEAAFGRELLVDLNLLAGTESGAHQQGAKRKKDLINTSMLIVDYRGIEDVKLGAFAVYRDDRSRAEGKPLLMGLQSQGMPSTSFSYWVLLAFVRGKDESTPAKKLSGYGLDVGATYRFNDLALYPSFTVGYAFGSGDANPRDGTNTEFRQTGLQSNEAKFGGLAKFKVYGEVLDPELGNLRIATAAVGIRPAPNLSVDLVYHHYWLSELAEELRNTAITALMNTAEGQSSKDVGSALDIVVGIRKLFGVRRLGVDLRAGLFFPGTAFLVDRGTPEKPSVRSADKGFTTFAKFWW